MTPDTVQTTGPRPAIAGDMSAIVRHWARLAPEGEALRCGERAWTWAQLAGRVDRLTRALAGLGVQAGQRIAVLDKNDPAQLEVTLAAAQGGFVSTVINWRLAPEELRYVLDDCGAVVAIVGAEFASVVDKIRPELAGLRHVIVLGGPAGQYESLLASAPGGSAPQHRPQPDDCFLQLYTSGTTGYPKGAMLTHRSVAAHTLTASEAFGFDRASVNLVAMPLFHVGGTSWALQSMYVGGRTIVVREVAPAAILQQIREQGVTHAFFVPTVYEFFLSLPGIGDADLSSVRCLGYGGSPMPGPLMRRCLDTFANDFYQVYGATEASGVFCVLRPEDHRDATHPERLASAGRPVSGVQLRVVDPDTGRDVEQGQTGEFWIKSAQTAIGYWNQPEDTAKAFQDGWYRTGDAGYVDPGGYVFVTDRTKDMVVTGGENVYPAEVERVLIEHPAIADASVIGVPDDVYGEAVKAVVIPEPGAAIDPAELIAFCRRHLAGYKCPKSVDVVDQLPRNATGKVLKRDLRARYWAGRNRAV